MKAEAEKLGYQLTVTDANNDQDKQIQDIKGLIAQKPDAIFIAPITEQLGNVVADAADADIPVFLLDRDVDHAVAEPGKDYVTVIVSDFVQQGRRAAWSMAQATGGTAKIIELEGTTGSSPAIDRKAGFHEAAAECPDMEIIVSQSADFTRADGQSVTETLLQSHPDATAVYAHNDEMALGAIAAIKAAGKVPGKASRSSPSTARRMPSPPWTRASSSRRSSPTPSSARWPSRPCSSTPRTAPSRCSWASRTGCSTPRTPPRTSRRRTEPPLPA
jgi:ribose transport system substrate-binding protein